MKKTVLINKKPLFTFREGGLHNDSSILILKCKSKHAGSKNNEGQLYQLRILHENEYDHAQTSLDTDVSYQSFDSSKG
jgi:hypothetical protein